jgi:hypothetical protein
MIPPSKHAISAQLNNAVRAIGVNSELRLDGIG